MAHTELDLRELLITEYKHLSAARCKGRDARPI